MFTQDRKQLRSIFFEVFAKLAQQEALTPGEEIIAHVIQMHPEYHSILQNKDKYLDCDYLPEFGQTNPFLHMSLHISIFEQIQLNKPESIQVLYQKLRMKHPDEHEATHKMMDCLAESLWEAKGGEPNMQDYLNKLSQLTA